MPKIVDYPRASFENSYELLKAVYELGDGFKIDSVAESMKRKNTGAFATLISASVKYGLVKQEKGTLSITEFGKNLLLAYTEKERQELRREAFFNVPIFVELYERYKGKKPPLEYLDNLLVRELNVPKNIGTAVKNYFVALAKDCGLMNESDILIANTEENIINDNLIQDYESSSTPNIISKENNNSIDENIKENVIQGDILKVSISFNNDNFNYETKTPSAEDFDMIELMLKNYKKKFEEIKSSSND